MKYYYDINETLQGFKVYFCEENESDYRESLFTVKTWGEVVEFFAEYGITPKRPHVDSIITPSLTYKPFKDIKEVLS